MLMAKPFCTGLEWGVLRSRTGSATFVSLTRFMHSFYFCSSSKRFQIHWILYLQCCYSVCIRSTSSSRAANRTDDIELCPAISSSHVLYYYVPMYIIHPEGNDNDSI